MKSLEKEFFFLAKFGLVFAVAELIINTMDFSWLENWLSTSIASVLGLQSVGNTVTVKGGVFEIGPSCTGLVGISVLAAVIYSLKKPGFKEKNAIFLAGATALLALNYARVAMVIVIGMNYGPEAAGIAHVISWFTTSIFILGLWYVFTKKLTGARDFSGFI